MLPMLGIYAEIYKNRHGSAASVYAVIEPFRDRFFPAAFDYKFTRPDGTETVETMPLFGDLVDGVELAVQITEAGKDDPIWRREVPDLAPGTHARRHTQYLREAVCLVQHVEEDEDRVLRDTRSFTRSLRLTGLRASLSSNSIRADGSTAGAGSRSSASAGSGSRSRASSESRSRETSEHAAAPPYPSPASLSRSI